MKYIKTLESYRHKPKFKINDIVKIKGENTFYIIDGYDFRKVPNDEMIKDICRIKKLSDIDKLANKEGFYKWKNESELEKVSDYEVSAKKFNL